MSFVVLFVELYAIVDLVCGLWNARLSNVEPHIGLQKSSGNAARRQMPNSFGWYHTAFCFGAWTFAKRPGTSDLIEWPSSWSFCFSVWNDVCHDVCCHALCVVDLEEVVDMLEDLGCRSKWYRMLRSKCMVHHGSLWYGVPLSHNPSQPFAVCVRTCTGLSGYSVNASYFWHTVIIRIHVICHMSHVILCNMIKNTYICIYTYESCHSKLYDVCFCF